MCSVKHVFIIYRLLHILVSDLNIINTVSFVHSSNVSNAQQDNFLNNAIEIKDISHLMGT